MRLSELKEGIVDDLIGEFPNNFPTKIPKATRPTKSETPRRVNMKGTSPSQMKNKYVQYIYGEELKDYLPHGTTVEGIAQLFSEENIALRDSVRLQVPVKELNNYREYDRNMRDGYTGKQTEQEYNELKQNIQDKGFDQSQYLVLDLTRTKSGDVTVHLGEGNHRLKIAKELGLKSLPVMFSYHK